MFILLCDVKAILLNYRKQENLSFGNSFVSTVRKISNINILIPNLKKKTIFPKQLIKTRTAFSRSKIARTHKVFNGFYYLDCHGKQCNEFAYTLSIKMPTIKSGFILSIDSIASQCFVIGRNFRSNLSTNQKLNHNQTRVAQKNSPALGLRFMGLLRNVIGSFDWELVL